MAALPEGTPCWVDAMFKDVEGAKHFYGEVLGWTFGEAASEFGNYTQAYSGGKAVAAVVPPMPGPEGQEAPSAWMLYLASPDAAAAAGKIRDNGGEVVMGPMQIGDFGTMVIGRDPSGVLFGVWQAGTHKGFEKQGETGSFAWAEVFTRDVAKTDAFFPAVFPYTAKKMADEQMDYKTFHIGGESVMGRMPMTGEFPPEIPPYIQVYFTVDNCDIAVEKSTKLGGKLVFGPMDSPFGRFAAVVDPQGAAFAVIDPKTTAGEVPEFM
ncbi:VOC family protein [Streptomyces sannanensis]|uniref:VOC family protein n=1 Tax=Streptomyces sannanensis TaxID=285536 RepID=A0ABP6S3V2_9ACTN